MLIIQINPVNFVSPFVFLSLICDAAGLGHCTTNFKVFVLSPVLSYRNKGPAHNPSHQLPAYIRLCPVPSLKKSLSFLCNDSKISNKHHFCLFLSYIFKCKLKISVSTILGAAKYHKPVMFCEKDN